jgi:hypothetical protein|tara:strand:+ start:511 stop:1377 length:867 start_codon:yes stop_codon:yes gene_type:complete
MAGIILGAVAAATSLAGAGLSFSQAAKQKKAQEKAQRESQALMQQARDRMQTQFYEQLQVPTEAYERQFRESTAQQKQALQALQESDPRTLAAGVGKVGAVGVAENQRIQEQMGSDLFNLQKLKADEQRAINEELVGMDVGEAASQNLMARDASYGVVQGIQGGLTGIGGALSAADSLVPLFSMSKEDRRAGRLFKGLSDTQKQNFLNKDGTRMSDTEIIDQLKLLTPDQQKALRKDPGSFDFNMFNVQQTDPASAFMFLKPTPNVDPIVVDPNDFGLYQGVSPFSVK